jgi:sugar (pentulose or hexulose) kinase
MNDILAIDVGTTAFKIGVFRSNLDIKAQTSISYSVNLYDRVKADIEPEKWWKAIQKSCAELKDHLSSVGVISLSVTTPGLVPMDEEGSSLGPAILFFDGRSNKQAKELRQRIGEQKLLRETCNLPVSGGSSLCSIMWIRENQPEVWNASAKFGHCNTYLVKKMTGTWAIDPSTTSITCMYNTARDDLTWNETVLSAAGVSVSKLPTLMRSHQKAGNLLPEVAASLGLSKEVTVLVGGNDAILAALSNVHGTCDITSICIDQPVYSPTFNVRCHVIPGRWVIFYVLNTGGKALEWFHSVFCQDMTEEHFYGHYVPSVLANFFDSERVAQVESEMPEYIPYLQGSRYTTETLTASFSNLTLHTDRDLMLLALIRGNLMYQAKHIEYVGNFLRLNREVKTTGGEARIKGFLRAKKRWMGDFDYKYIDQSSLLGAAILGQQYLMGENALTKR